jgi:hypothetical protein
LIYQGNNASGHAHTKYHYYFILKITKMKKYLLIGAILFTSICLKAQDDDLVIHASKKITKQLTPQQVVDSLQKRFPNAKAVQYYQTPSSGVRNGWAITEDDDLGSADVDYYTLTFNNNNIKYYGLYNADGTLIMSKLAQSSTSLPTPVKTSLKNLAGPEYKDWKVQSKSYHKIMHHKNANTYYEVVAKKGSETKHIFLKPDGTIVKEK